MRHQSKGAFPSAFAWFSWKRILSRASGRAWSGTSSTRCLSSAPVYEETLQTSDTYLLWALYNTYLRSLNVLTWDRLWERRLEIVSKLKLDVTELRDEQVNICLGPQVFNGPYPILSFLPCLDDEQELLCLLLILSQLHVLSAFDLKEMNSAYWSLRLPATWPGAS